MAVNRSDLNAVVAHLEAGGSVDDFLRCNGIEPREYTDLETCYRCWQVAKTVKATLLVTYNEGTKHEWSSPSCRPCWERDHAQFPEKTTLVSRLATASSPMGRTEE